MATDSLFSLRSARQTERLPNIWSVETGHKMSLFGHSFHPESITRVYVVRDRIAFAFVKASETKGYFFLENKRGLRERGLLLKDLWLDENAALRAMGIDAKPDIQIPTGIQGTSCIQGVLKRDLERRGPDTAYLKFLKRSPVCPTTPGCRFVDNMVALMFAFLKEISFNGIIRLDDDVIADNLRLLLFRIMIDSPSPSIYEKYGFRPRNREEAKIIRALIRKHDNCRGIDRRSVFEKYKICDRLLHETRIIKRLIDTYKNMVNPDFRSVRTECRIEFDGSAK